MTSKIKAVGFDWDGTLVDSIIFKSKCFAESVIKSYPSVEDNRKEIEELYLETRGNLRTHQLEKVQNKYNLKKLNNDKLEKWSDLFTKLYENQRSPLFKGTLEVLEALHQKNYSLFLCSSVPQKYLDETLEKYPKLKKYFDFILGTQERGEFKKGIPHLNFVSKRYELPTSKIAFCGDGERDIVGANEAGSFSIAKVDSRIPSSRENLKKHNPDLIINKLEELLEVF